MATQHKWFISGGVVLVLAAGFFVANFFTPPFFVQFGQHYFAGTELVNAGWYYCDPPNDFNNCEPHRESFASAVARDPDIKNWWPIRAELIRLDESYD